MTNHVIYQKCQHCNSPNSNKVRFVFSEGVPSETFKRQIDRQIVMWTSKCSKCGASEGKHFGKTKDNT